MAMRPENSAGVIAPPPLLFAGTLLVCVALDQALHAETGLPRSGRLVLGSMLAIAAAGLFVSATGRFRRARTPVAPWLPTTAIVTTGVYGLTRNPIYVAMGLLYAAIALAFDSGLALLTLIPLLAVIRYGVIGREERYLARVFGETYVAYCQAVRRWI